MEKVSRLIESQPQGTTSEEAVGVGLGHARRVAIDRVPPEPLVVPGPDAARGAIEDVPVVDLVVRQRQGVAPVRGRRDGDAEDGRVAYRPRGQDRQHREGHDQPVDQALPRGSRPDRESGDDRQHRAGEHAGPGEPGEAEQSGRPRRHRASRQGQGRQGRHQEKRRERLGHDEPALPEQDGVGGDDQRRGERPLSRRDPSGWP